MQPPPPTPAVEVTKLGHLTFQIIILIFMKLKIP
jgi:hypothetical protein